MYGTLDKVFASEKIYCYDVDEMVTYSLIERLKNEKDEEKESILF